DLSLERKIYVLWNVASKAGNAQRVKFRRNNPDQVTACVEQWATTVARLHGCADLQIATVISNARKGAHVANRYVRLSRKNARKRIPQCDDCIATANRKAFSEHRDRSGQVICSTEADNSEVIPFIARNQCAQLRNSRCELYRDCLTCFNNMRV